MFVPLPPSRGKLESTNIIIITGGGCTDGNSTICCDSTSYKEQRVHTYLNSRRYISLVSLLWWHKIVYNRRYVWPLTLRLWWSSQNFEFQQSILVVGNCFLVANIECGFHYVKCLYEDFKVTCLWCMTVLMQLLLKVWILFAKCSSWFTVIKLQALPVRLCILIDSEPVCSFISLHQVGKLENTNIIITTGDGCIDDHSTISCHSRSCPTDHHWIHLHSTNCTHCAVYPVEYPPCLLVW